MNKNLINHLYYIYTNKFVKREIEDDNFSLYFRKILKNSHFFTRGLIIFCSILLNLLSLLINFKMFKNLSLEKSESLINLTSKFSIIQNFFKVIKVYSYIHCFEKKNEKKFCFK